MSKEIILKYLTEFNAWVKGQEVYVMFSNGGHRLVDSLEDFNEDVKYIVLKDSYFFYRKALAEGKTIEYLGQSSNVWHEVPEPDFILHPTCFRIKPDEPKFKVGDFVTPLNRDINCSVWKIDKVLSCNTLASGIILLDPRTIQPWTPVKGEWCWFYDSKSSKSAVLAQFKEISNDYFMSITDTYWKCCEPFLNSIPSYLKDK